MKDIKPHATLDIRHLIAPITLLQVENRLAKMAPGEVLEVFLTDLETKVDLVDIVKNSGHRCILADNASDYFRFLIEKGA